MGARCCARFAAAATQPCARHRAPTALLLPGQLAIDLRMHARASSLACRGWGLVARGSSLRRASSSGSQCSQWRSGACPPTPLVQQQRPASAGSRLSSSRLSTLAHASRLTPKIEGTVDMEVRAAMAGSD